MGLVTWTAVFTLAVRDTPQEVSQSLNGLIGAHLQREMQPLLNKDGWDFQKAWPEDHGWHAEALVVDDGKSVVATFVTCPELDEASADGHALKNRWRIVVGLDLGMLPKTKARRTALLKRLARNAEDGVRHLGAQDIVWELGGP